MSGRKILTILCCGLLSGASVFGQKSSRKIQLCLVNPFVTEFESRLSRNVQLDLNGRTEQLPRSRNPFLTTKNVTCEPEDNTVVRDEVFHLNKRAMVETSSQQNAPSHEDDAHDLAKQLSNPVASLISLPFQSNFDFGMGTGSGWRYTLNTQPVIPFALNSNWNLISRTILPFIHQGNVSLPGRSETGLGDITQSFFFSPAKTEPLIWAVGPVVLIPTATNDFLGTEKFGLGPTVLGLKQTGGTTYGVLANHIWSVAGSETRADVNSTFVQPFLAHTTKDAWTYSINAEASYDWVGNHWAVPIHPTVAKLVRFGKHPVSFTGGLRCWATSPPGGPRGCGLRFVVTPLFPR